MCCVLLVGLDASIVGTAGPTIVRDLSDYALFPWIVSAYLLASAAVVPIYGQHSPRVMSNLHSRSNRSLPAPLRHHPQAR